MCCWGKGGGDGWWQWWWGVYAGSDQRAVCWRFPQSKHGVERPASARCQRVRAQGGLPRASARLLLLLLLLLARRRSTYDAACCSSFRLAQPSSGARLAAGGAARRPRALRASPALHSCCCCLPALSEFTPAAKLLGVSPGLCATPLSLSLSLLGGASLRCGSLLPAAAQTRLLAVAAAGCLFSADGTPPKPWLITRFEHGRQPPHTLGGAAAGLVVQDAG